MTDEYVRYLEAKRTVDDRSLSTRVIDSLRDKLPATPTIFEAGCGTGVTVSRLLDWGSRSGTYRGVDTDIRSVEYARENRPAELREAGYEVTETELGGQVESLDFRFEVGDAFEAIAAESGLDLIVAQQFLDLVDTELALDVFTDALAPGGLAYLALTFDGHSVFQPDHPDDSEVLAAYHESMDDRPSGDSRAGRHLAYALQRQSGTICAIDSSDAIIRPQNGSYPDDEQYVLETILNFIEDEVLLDDVPELDSWLSARRNQLDSAKLFYAAHRYDLLYQTPEY